MITVIMPFYNGIHLQDSVSSVVGQDYPHIELIIVDDGSEAALAAEMKEKAELLTKDRIDSFRWISHGENKGTVVTVNDAFRAASGKYIFTLANDDVFWNRHVLSEWVDAFEKTGAEVMLGYRAIYDNDMKEFQCLSPSPAQAEMMRRGDAKRILRELYKMNFIFGCAVARTKESVEKYGYIPECYRLLEDYPTAIRYFHQNARFLLHERIVIKYRKGGTSYSTNVTEMYQKDVRKVYEQEIMPYIRPKFLGKILLSRQLSERVVKSGYLQMREWGNGPVWNLLCHIRYPRFFYEKMKTVAERPSREKELRRLLELSSGPEFPGE